MEISEQEKTNDFPPAYQRMYEVSGQDAITKHSFERYLKDKEEQEKIIEDLVLNSPAQYAQKIQNAPDNEKASLIRAGLRNANAEVKIECSRQIWYAPKTDWDGLQKELINLIERSLASNDSETGVTCARMIPSVSEEARAPLILIGLSNDNTEVRRACAEKIWDVPRDSWPSLISAGLRTDDVSVHKACSSMIDSVPEKDGDPLREQLLALVEKGFESDIPEIQKEYGLMIDYVAEGERNFLREKVADIIEKGFAQGSEKDQKKYAEMIADAPEKMRALLIKLGFEGGNAEAGAVCARTIKEVPDYGGNERSSLITLGFTSGNAETKKACAEMIVFAPIDKRSSLIKTGLDSGDAETGKECARMIKHAPDKEKDSLIRYGLENSNPEVGKECAWMLRYVEGEKKELFELAKKKLGNALLEPQLYKEGNISDQKFSRRKFEKTGPGTVLIGGSLKGKTILQYMEPEKFLFWQKLYENCELWQNAGFDYVPIQPIQSFKAGKNGLVDVAGGVLDLSFENWKGMTEDFSAELSDDRDKILNVLKSENMNYRDPHPGNFCLRFFRDENGNADFTKKPRIYLIDFDHAWPEGHK